jgi:hypothetical protein
MQELPVGHRSLATEPEQVYFCKYCGTLVTSVHDRIEQNGEFRHTFTNPAGLVFSIGCFADAAGCAVVGDPTGDRTWFRGYQWCYALCSGCASHLGWHYEGKRGKTFFGLVLDRLIEPDA